jgi:single-strand DNA-binding protein
MAIVIPATNTIAPATCPAIESPKATSALPEDGTRAQGGKAMAINKVIVIGNLGANPQVHALPSGENVVNMSLATNERFTDRKGDPQQRTEWHRIVAFGKLAEACGQYLSKGRRVYVEGRLTTRQYEAKDGSGKRYRTEIIARQIRFLDRRRDASGATAAGEQSIPF